MNGQQSSIVPRTFSSDDLSMFPFGILYYEHVLGNVYTYPALFCLKYECADHSIHSIIQVVVRQLEASCLVLLLSLRNSTL